MSLHDEIDGRVWEHGRERFVRDVDDALRRAWTAVQAVLRRR